MGRGRMRRRVCLVGVAVCVALVATACGGGDDDDDDAATPPADDEVSSGSDASGGGTGPGTPAARPLDETTTVQVTYSFGIEPFAPLFVADAMGEFEKENLDVELITVPSNEGTVQVASNRALLHVAGVTAAGFNAMNAGTGLRYVSNISTYSDESQEGLWIRKDRLGDDGEVDPEDIDGMQIALGSGGLSSFSTIPVSQWLEENDRSLDDIEPVTIGGPDMLIALEQGSVDAGYLITPFWQQPTVSECCIMVTDQPPQGGGNVYVVNDQALQDRPEVVDAVFRALVRTVRTYLQGDYHADPEVMDVLSEAFQTDEEVIASAPPMVFDPDLPLQDDVLALAQDVWLEAGILDYDEPLPLDEVADTSPVDRAVAG